VLDLEQFHDLIEQLRLIGWTSIRVDLIRQSKTREHVVQQSGCNCFRRDVAHRNCLGPACESVVSCQQEYVSSRRFIEWSQDIYLYSLKWASGVIYLQRGSSPLRVAPIETRMTGAQVQIDILKIFGPVESHPNSVQHLVPSPVGIRNRVVCS